MGEGTHTLTYLEWLQVLPIIYLFGRYNINLPEDNTGPSHTKILEPTCMHTH